MTRRTDSKGDPINRNRRASAHHTPNVDVDTNEDGGALMRAVVGPDALTRVVYWFAEHDGGYLKMRRGTDSADLHLAWTWSMGPHAGTYVYVRTQWWRYLFGLELLQQKVLEVETGARRSTPDRRGGGT